MKKPGAVTGCTNPFHAHLADVTANLTKLNQCTFVDPPDNIDFTMSRLEAQNLVDGIRRLQFPGYRLESFMLLLTKKLEKNA